MMNLIEVNKEKQCNESFGQFSFTAERWVICDKTQLHVSFR